MPDDVSSSFGTVNTEQNETQNYAKTEDEKEHFSAKRQSVSPLEKDSRSTRKQDDARDNPRLEISEFSDPWGDKHYVLKTEFECAKARKAKWVRTCNSSGGPTDARHSVPHLGLIFLEFSRRRDYIAGQVTQTNSLVSLRPKKELEQSVETVALRSPDAAFVDGVKDVHGDSSSMLLNNSGQMPTAHDTQPSTLNDENSGMEESDQAAASDETVEPAEDFVHSYELKLATGALEVYYVRHSDLEVALQNGDANVALCQPDGSEVPDDAQFKLIEVRSICPTPVEELSSESIQAGKISKRSKMKR